MEPGSLSLSDTCTVCGRRPPRFIFFAASGSLCNAAQLLLDRGLITLLPEHEWWAPTACWMLSYTLSISLRHFSHAFFVFGRHAGPMWLALGKTYLAYVSTIVFSTLVNLGLVWGAHFKPDIALIVTSVLSTIYAYSLLSKRSLSSLRVDMAYSPTVTIGADGYQQLPSSVGLAVELSDVPDVLDVPAASESPSRARLGQEIATDTVWRE